MKWKKNKKKKEGNHFQATRVSSHRKYKVAFYLLVGIFFFMLLLPFRCLKSFFGYIRRSNIYSTFIRSLFALVVIVKNLNAFAVYKFTEKHICFFFHFYLIRGKVPPFARSHSTMTIVNRNGRYLFWLLLLVWRWKRNNSFARHPHWCIWIFVNR